MANIPTTQASESAQTGDLRVRDSGAGGIALAEGARALTSGLNSFVKLQERTLLYAKQQAKVLKNADDFRYASETYNNEKLLLAEFRANRENATAEDLPQRIVAFSKDRISQYAMDKFPSKEAYDLFNTHYGNWVSSQVVSAVDTSVNNKIVANINSVNTQVSTAITTFRTLRNNDEKAALASIVDSVAQIGTSIDASFKEYYPSKAHQLHENLITQTVLSVMGTNPSAAKAILNSSKDVDEQTRLTLNNEIGRAMQVKSSEQRSAFERLRDNHMTMVKVGNTNDPIPSEFYTDVLPEAQAKELKAKDDEQVAIWTKGNTIIQEVQAQNAKEQQKVLNTLGDTTKWKTDTAKQSESLYHFVAKQISDNIKLQQDSPVDFLQNYNRQVKQDVDFVGSSQKEDLPAALSRLNDTLLKYQGAPPEGVNTKESTLYLNRPQNDWHLLGKQKAEELGAGLNLSKPKEFLKKMQDVLLQYPNEQHQAIIFNDLVTLGKVSQQYQFAVLNQKAWWVDTYLGAIEHGKDIKVSEKDYNAIENQVDVDENFVKLKSTMTKDNFQGAQEVRGFRDGIIQWAKAEVSRGRSVKDAVSLVSKNLINSELGFTKVNEKPLMLVLDKGKGQGNRSQWEVDDIGRRLGFVPQFIPMAEVDKTPFTALEAFGSNEDKKQAALSDQLNARGFWQTSADGQSASFYAMDEQGLQPFQVRDNKNLPFVVHFDDLPTFNQARPYNLTEKWDMERLFSLAAYTAGLEHKKYPNDYTKTGRPPWLKTK